MSEASTYLGGRVQIVIERSEMRMSHWIEAPKIIDARTGQTILDLHGSLWDLFQVSELPGSLVLRMRKYPGTSAPVELAIALDRPGGELDGRFHDAASLRAALEAR